MYSCTSGDISVALGPVNWILYTHLGVRWNFDQLLEQSLFVVDFSALLATTTGVTFHSWFCMQSDVLIDFKEVM